jgi:hypothetical protein
MTDNKGESINQSIILPRLRTDTETDTGKETILPPSPKKSFLDRAHIGLRERIFEKNSQIRIGHRLSAPYLKRVSTDRDENIYDLCLWCGQFGMSRTQVFLRCALVDARTAIWDRSEMIVETANDQNL